MRIVVPKLQSLILSVTRRVAQLELYIIPSFPTFQHCPRMNYHIAKKHSVPRSIKTYKCKLCHAEFLGIYALRQHKNTQHGTQIGFGENNIDVEDIVGDVDDQRLREELESCKHFLTDTEMENGTQSFQFCHVIVRHVFAHR